MYTEGGKPAYEAIKNLPKNNPEARTAKLGEFYDKLLAERERLNQEFAKHPEYNLQTEFYGCLDADIVGKEKVADVRDYWLARVRAETDLLEPLDELGIEIFKDDLENQPGFPNTHIIFGGGIIHRDNAVNLARGETTNEGQAHLERDIVEIHERKPSLSRQLRDFLENGRLPNALDTFVHELIHRVHFNKNPQTELSLTEAQANWSGLFKPGDREEYSIAGIIKRYEGTGLEPKKFTKAIRDVFKLYAMGVSKKEVANLVVNANLEDEVKKRQKALRLEDIDLSALQDIWKLHASNQVREAQLLLYKVLSESYPKEERADVRHAFRHSNILSIRLFDKQGHDFIPPEGNAVYPDEDNFMQEDGAWAGLFFGEVPAAARQKGKPQFGVGKYEYSKDIKHAALRMENKPERVQALLESLKKHSVNIAHDSKVTLLEEALESWPRRKFPKMIQEILQAVFTQEEASAFYKELWGHEIKALLKIFQKRTDQKAEEQPVEEINAEAWKRFYALRSMARLLGVWEEVSG